jgi:hypothetical protein
MSCLTVIRSFLRRLMPQGVPFSLARRSRAAYLALVLGSVLASFTFASPAAADENSRADHDGVGRTHIGVDFDYAASFGHADLSGGTGGAVRIGREFDLVLLTLIPEIGGNYETFSGAPDSRIYSGFAGGRLAVGKIIEPSIFAHVGVGHIDGWQDRTAPTLDAGLALDFTMIPLIDIGVHAGIATMLATQNDNGVSWGTAGLQAALVF